MAKRKRLTPAQPTYLSASETGPALSPGPLSVGAAPIAQVASDTSAAAALEELSGVLENARAKGLMIEELPLAAVDETYLVRDRIVQDEEDMRALMDSIRARGQQTPIEVVKRDGAAGGKTHGLISGWRRLTALRRLYEETSDSKFASVKALVVRPDSAADAYLAMVEENEIRADLSFYERARLAHEAARIGVFPDAGAAVKALFVHVSASKRSKILNFVALHQALGAALRFPEAIPEHLGLALAKRAAADSDFAPGLARRLASRAPTDAAGERAVLDRALAPAPKEAAQKATQDAGADQPEGVQMTARPGRIILSGQGVTPDLARDLQDWLAARG